MKVAIVHYHLKPGGVTRVIETAVESLRGSGIETVVLAGESYEGDHLARTRVVEGLGYSASADPDEGKNLAGRLCQTVVDAFGSLPDVWHIHNHSLGKNVALPEAVWQLAQDGARILLQPHDFAEDGRPGNYVGQRTYYENRWNEFEEHLYPTADQICYAPLNQRDAHHLKTAGLPAEQISVLANCVEAPPVEKPAHRAFPEAERFLLYPTRGIRRKNLGELALLSLLEGPQTVFATTLAPANAAWKPVHAEWAHFMARHRLPVELAFGERGPFTYPELMGSADAIVTTSVAEGFGLAFLEPWLAGKAVVGRNLPQITADFSRENVDLSGLYARLDVPLDAISRDRFRTELRAALARSFDAYNRPLPREALDEAWDAAVADGNVDFGRLSEEFQEEAVENCLRNPGFLDSIQRPDLTGPGTDVIAQQSAAIEKSWNRQSYGDRLRSLYDRLLAADLTEVGSISPDSVLDAFLRPADFCLLRS